MPLKNLLAEMLRQAELTPGSVRRSGKLAHGLGIAVRYLAESETFQVQLEREKTYPAGREWTTVLACLPEGFEQVGDVRQLAPNPETKIHYLRGTVRKCASLEPHYVDVLE
jgi:hypothetical protein